MYKCRIYADEKKEGRCLSTTGFARHVASVVLSQLLSSILAFTSHNKMTIGTFHSFPATSTLQKGGTYKGHKRYVAYLAYQTAQRSGTGGQAG
jgi:hypothetical protein